MAKGANKCVKPRPAACVHGRELHNERIIGQAHAIATHHDVGRKVREASEEIDGSMPEDLPTEPSIKPLLGSRRRRHKELPAASSHEQIPNGPTQGELWGRP